MVCVWGSGHAMECVEVRGQLDGSGRLPSLCPQSELRLAGLAASAFTY